MTDRQPAHKRPPRRARRYVQVGSRHSSSQAPDPDSLHEQSFEHPVIVLRELPVLFRVHPLPGHERVAGPDASAVTVQSPPGQENVHGPLPWHMNSQPAPGQDREQGSDVTHQHICPGEQLVEFAVCVVATHAMITERLSATATKRTI